MGYDPPSKEKAHSHMLNVSLLDKNGYGYSLFSTDMTRLDIGAGNNLYFKWLRYMSVVFFVGSILYLPSFLFNYYGQSYEKEKKSDFVPIPQLELTTLGNLLLNKTDSLTLSDFSMEVSVDALGMNVRLVQASMVMSVCEIIFCLFFGVSLIWYRRTQALLVDHLDEAVTNISDYTVYVTSLPHGATEESLQRHFADLFCNSDEREIVSVKLVKKNGPFLEHLKKKGLLFRELDRAKALVYTTNGMKGQNKYKSLQSKMNALLVEEKKFPHEDQLPTVAAFVTFNNGDDKAECVNKYSGLRLFQPRRLRFYNYRLDVVSAVQPDNVLWENIEHQHTKGKSFVIFLSTCIAILLLGVSFALIVAAQFRKTVAVEFTAFVTGLVQNNVCNDLEMIWDGAASLSVNTCNTSVAEVGPLAPLWAAVDLKSWNQDELLLCNSTQSNCRKCYCENLWDNMAQYLKLQTLQNQTMFSWQRNAGLSHQWEVCGDFFTDKVLALTFGSLSAVCVVAINFALKFSARKLSIWERHSTQAKQIKATVQKIFVGQFVNVAILILVINARVGQGALFDLGVFRFVGNRDCTQDTGFPDFDGDWYKIVGSAILFTMVIQTLTPIMLNGLQAFRCRWRRRHSALKALTQEDMNEAFEGPEFDLPAQYGTALSYFFICFFYSPGMPILFFFACINYSIVAIVDKICLLRLFKRPDYIDEAVSLFAARAAPYALFLHMTCALWMLSNPNLPSGSFSIDQLDKFTFGQASTIKNSATTGLGVSERIQRYNTLPLFVLWLLLLVWLVFHLTPLWRLFRAFLLRCCCNKKEEAQEGLLLFRDAVRNQKLTGPSVYSMEGVPRYRLLFAHSEHGTRPREMTAMC